MPSRGVHIVGTRTFASEVAGLAREAGLEVLGLLEPYDRSKVGRTVHDLPVRWLDDGPEAGGDEPEAVILGTGETHRRELAARVLESGFEFAGALIHPAAHVASSSEFALGAVVAPGVVVGACAWIGEGVVLGRGALVGHHTRIAPFCTIGPGANVAGNVSVEANAVIAMGALVRDHVTVGAGALVAMGAVVVDDVPAGAEVRGVPARAVASAHARRTE